MQHSVLEELIRSHLQTLELCRTLLANELKGEVPTQEMIAAIADEDSCEFSRVFQSGELHFEGAVAKKAIPTLHATFHSLAAMILTLVTTRSAENSEIASYMSILDDVSNQLIALLKVARVRPK